MAVININGVDFPCPVNLQYIVTDAVNNGRNSLGEMIGEKVGRTQIKLNNLEWKWLTADEVTRLVQVFSNFFVIVRFYSILHGDWVTLKMYPGDRTIDPYYNYVDDKPTRILSFKVNIIDCGYV